MKKNNSLIHQLPPGPNPPDEVYSLVEIPRGCSNKYEYGKQVDAFFLNRVLYESVFYPAEYGLIPQTLEEDKDPIDIMVLSTHATFPGCVIKSRPVALLRLEDTGEKDNKIIAVPENDPRFEHINNLDDLQKHTKKEFKKFWETYSDLQEDKWIKVLGWGSAEEAKEIIKQGIERYNNS